MAVVVSKEKVRGVQEVVLQTLERHKHDFAPIEVLYGLAELIGRLVVKHTQGTWIEKRDLLLELVNHTERTVIAGVQHQGHNRIETLN